MSTSRLLQLATLLCVVAIVVWQIQLWFGKGSIPHIKQLQFELAQQKKQLNKLERENSELAAEINELKTGMDTVEAIARRELGMIKEGETLFMVTTQTVTP